MTQSQNNKLGKNWCFTLNNYTDEDYERLLSYDCRFVQIGKEVASTTGTPHLQGFMVFHANKRLTGCKKVDPKASWRLCSGSVESNLAYTSKDGNYENRGELPKSRKVIGEDNKERWHQIIAAARNGTCEEQFPREFVAYNNFVTRSYRPMLEELEVYNGFWFYGPPGTGKSKTARDKYPGYYDKLLNKWWDGYNHEEVVIIDDLDHAHTHMGTFLKRYADHPPFRAEYKGGSTMIRPKTIVVTSNYTPEEIWPQDEMLVAAIVRRYKLVRFDASFPVLKK